MEFMGFMGIKLEPVQQDSKHIRFIVFKMLVSQKGEKRPIYKHLLRKTE